MIKDRDIKETKFEEDLKKYFPDIYRIHTAGKFDRYVWTVFEGMMQMVDCNGYGKMEIIYQNGKINRVTKSLVTTENSRPGLTHPAEMI